MKRILCFLYFLVCSALLVAPAQAAYIELRPDGISIAYDGEAYDPGDGDLTLEVWIMPDEGDLTLDNWSFDILYDDSEIVDYTEGDNLLPSGWFAFSDPVVADAPPYVQAIEALYLMGDGLSFYEGDYSDGYLAAVLYFTFDYASLIQDGIADFSLYLRAGAGITVNYTDEGWDLLDDELYSIGPDLVSAQVPIPAAIWLLGSGLLGLMGFRRRVRQPDLTHTIYCE